jgi:LmbE family N-acetylglucosaminyl deacetylase
MHPYHRFVTESARLVREARALPLGGLAPRPRPTLAADAPRVLVFAPHPDDECLVGALPLRLLREARMRVVDVAVTLGSRRERRTARLDELRGACAFLGFDVVTAAADGLERINAATRAQDPPHWQAAVAAIAGLLAREQPRAIFCPHGADHNSTHVGTHHLVMDALAQQAAAFTCAVVETEYWAPMSAPNLMVESSPDDVADLVAATSFHAGEVTRNPYHLELPAWLQDNVRRGGEIVGAQGGAAPDFAFATLYRLGRWRAGRLEAIAERRVLSADDDPASLLG